MRYAAEPQATGFPVVIGEGSHPFPFRTRKLSPLPPMVLHAKVCGRVGHCRDYFCGPDAKASGLFLCDSGTVFYASPRMPSHRWDPPPHSEATHSDMPPACDSCVAAE